MQSGILPDQARRAKPFKRREIHLGDRIFAVFIKLPSLGLAILLLLITVFLVKAAMPALAKFGFSFLGNSVWDPVQDIYGATPVIFGTIVSSLIAIALATPLSLGVALFLTEVSNARVGRVAGFLVEMLAAIPSVVYGLWGIFVLAPWLRRFLEPLLAKSFGLIPIIGILFQGPAYGVGMLAAGLILAIMITPTISSIAREIFSAVPETQREAALGIGATRWEMIRIAVFDSSRRGILGAVILGLGRALGETMAVTMVIGNRHEIAASLFAPGSTMASIIANEYAEATSDLHIAVLAEIGLTLFAVTFIINSLARIFISRSGNR